MMIQDPKDNDRREPWEVAAIFVAIVLLAAVILSVSGCSPRIYERVVYVHDTTRVVKVDSLWQYQHDSVFVREKGDTVYKYVEHIRYRDRVKVDTLVRVRVDSVTVETVKEVEVTQPLTWCQRTKIGAFWWLLAAVLGLLAWTFRKPILAIIKTLLKI